jgi:hypothetical protein
MAYKSRKRLREKCLFGADGAITAAATLAAAAMNVAATTKAAKEQAKAVKANADAQAKAQTQAAKVQSEALAQQSENNTQNMTEQINAQKELQESQNDIMKEMNLNLALQAGQQNAEERDKASKIVVRCGGSLRGKRLAGGLTLQDSNYVVPVGQGLVLLRGGSPTHPQDQTHANYHKNIISGRYNKGSYLKVGNKEIEAEAGGNKTTGEIIDPSNKFVYSQRRFLPDGTSPVEKILAGYPKGEVALEQELTKKFLGIKNNGNKAMYGSRYTRTGGKVRQKFATADYTSDRDRYLSQGYNDSQMFPTSAVPTYADDLVHSQRNLQNYYASLPGSTILPNSDYFQGVSVVPQIPEPTSSKINLPSSLTSPTQPQSKGSWWSHQSPATQSAIIGGVANLGGTLISALGNGIASGYMRRANKYANDVLTNARNQTRDTYIDAYKKMHGIDANGLINEDDFKATHAIANVRAGRFNINPQLAQVERDSFRQLKSIRGGINSALARQRLMSDVATRIQDARDKLYGEQTNQVEKINQNNIAQLNEVAMKNAELDTRSKTNLSTLKVDVAKYNNDIENTKLQGIADATADALMGNAQGNAQTRINNAGLRSNFAISTLGGIGNGLASAGKQWYDADQAYRTSQANISRYMAASTNPNGMALAVLAYPNQYSNENIKLAYNATDNENNKKQLAAILRSRGVTV